MAIKDVSVVPADRGWAWLPLTAAYRPHAITDLAA